MNSRALYRLGQVTVRGAWLIYAAIFMASLRITDYQGWFLSLSALGLATWAGYGMNRAMEGLRDEANRDTRLGFNGPAPKEDLL